MDDARRRTETDCNMSPECQLCQLSDSGGLKTRNGQTFYVTRKRMKRNNKGKIKSSVDTHEKCFKEEWLKPRTLRQYRCNNKLKKTFKYWKATGKVVENTCIKIASNDTVEFLSTV